MMKRSSCMALQWRHNGCDFRCSKWRWFRRCRSSSIIIPSEHSIVPLLVYKTFKPPPESICILRNPLDFYIHLSEIIFDDDFIARNMEKQYLGVRKMILFAATPGVKSHYVYSGRLWYSVLFLACVMVFLFFQLYIHICVLSVIMVCDIALRIYHEIVNISKICARHIYLLNVRFQIL